jgi:hypothetical protein
VPAGRYVLGEGLVLREMKNTKAAAEMIAAKPKA